MPKQQTAGGGGRGRSPLPFSRPLFISRFKSSSHLADTDQIVQNLRAKYPEYRRCNLRFFKSFVSQTLDPHFEDDDSSATTSSRSPKPKKPRRSDVEEERLLHHESEFLRRRNRQRKPSTPSEEEEEEEEEGSVSTSEDAIFEEPVEPEFDLMKSMLRANYRDLKSKEEEEKNVEVEVDEKRKMEEMLGVGNQEGDVVLKGGGGGDGGEMKEGKKGPRFRDLGGMKGVLDELMMEVIVPLYHPQLPRWLGVRPMAGILLHGPPGCGKTKLAHAIANETGVPFYKISATEVVSGVSGNAFFFRVCVIL